MTCGNGNRESSFVNSEDTWGVPGKRLTFFPLGLVWDMGFFVNSFLLENMHGSMSQGVQRALKVLKVGQPDKGKRLLLGGVDH
jgi:hypothetical protein